MRRIALVLVSIFALTAALFVAGAAGANNASLCAKQWSEVQNGSGGSFSSLPACASSRDIYNPVLSVPASGQVGEILTITGQGFHPSQSVVLSVVGEINSTQITLATDTSGNFSESLRFNECWGDVTFTVTDASGVHASGVMIFC